MIPARNRAALSCIAVDPGLWFALDEWHIAMRKRRTDDIRCEYSSQLEMFCQLEFSFAPVRHSGRFGQLAQKRARGLFSSDAPHLSSPELWHEEHRSHLKNAFKDLYYCDLSGTFISVHAEVNRCHDAKN